MNYVIKLIADAGIEGLSEHTGRYVLRYDPNYENGLGRVWSCADPGDALQFEDGGAALEFWRQTSTVRPLRHDGKPNRPLTAFTVSVLKLEEALHG